MTEDWLNVLKITENNKQGLKLCFDELLEIEKFDDINSKERRRYESLY
jgi:hypothetical protein